jgi:hypothetical protein
MAAALLFTLHSSLFTLSSCGSRDGYFKLEGHFLKMNQGEFYLYSPDGIIPGIDTIRLNGGRFSHEIPCTSSGTLMLVFPNFSEQPIFAEEGQSVSLDGDASHLRELKVKGTKPNELLTKFRMQISKISPAEEQQHAATFIQDNPESPVSLYLLRRYFILTDKPTTTVDGAETTDEDDHTYTIYFDDIRSLRAPANRADKVGLFLKIRYFGDAVGVESVE